LSGRAIHEPSTQAASVLSSSATATPTVRRTLRPAATWLSGSREKRIVITPSSRSPVFTRCVISSSVCCSSTSLRPGYTLAATRRPRASLTSSW
jgi:hypothetical protein